MIVSFYNILILFLKKAVFQFFSDLFINYTTVIKTYYYQYCTVIDFV